MPRSLWGWGNTEQALDLPPLMRRVEPFFGARSVEDAAEPHVPTARLEPPAELRALASTDASDRAAHCWGKAYPDRLRGFRGDFRAAPDFVVRPNDERDVERVLEIAERERLAVVPFGGGSSFVGGVEAVPSPSQRGALTLDLGRLSAVLELDDVSRAARIQAGAFGPTIEAQLKDFTLRHFPQSFEFSTLGGWIATRAGGHFATVTTHIDDLVEAVRMLTPRGTWQTRRVPATGAGPDANRLVCGSEGTLGVITEAWMRVRKRPSHRAGASVHFDDWPAAVDATRAIAQSGLAPANCRLLDAAEVMVNDVARDGSSVLVLGFEADDYDVRPWLTQALKLCVAGRVVERSGESWKDAFLKGPYFVDALIRLGVIVDTFETACTWSVFPTLYGAVTSTLRDALERVCGGGVVTCRFTHVYPDGPAPYFTFLGAAKRGAELEQWNELKRVATQTVLSSGGTVTHHHGVGRVHKEGWALERPAPYARALAAMKRELDPSGVLNPGVLL
jgi:alkyldihydroxyacetonephosphate synthase